MSIEVWGMMCGGIVALAAGPLLARNRFRAASGPTKILVLGPIFEGAPLAVFSAEHFTAARDLMPIVPHWLPFPLFWTYFVGICLLAAAVSFIAFRHVRWSASLLALLFLIIVATVDLPNLPASMHDRFFWILTVRETSFAGGAMVLAGSVWSRRNRTAGALMNVGRTIVALVMVFYAIEHFFHPDHVPGVPLAKLIPAWMPAPTLISWFIGLTLLLAGVAMLIPRTTRIAAATAGSILVLLTAFFYVPIAATEIHGLTREDLRGKPRFCDIVFEFVDFARGAEWIIHNAPFDVAFFDAEFNLCGLPCSASIYASLVDTLALARDTFPGKRNNLDALCERFGVANAHRTLHGALLDAQLLAEVYLAMTRGQESLTIDIVTPRPEVGEGFAAEGPLQLLLVLPSADELAAHHAYLVELDRDAKGACLWLALAADPAAGNMPVT